MIANRLAFAALLAIAAVPADAQEAATASVQATPPPAARPVEVETLPPRNGNFSFEGPFGTFDRAALQRGFQVYRDVCSACHSLRHIAFRNLADEGGPGLTADQVRALAAAYRVPAGPNEQGQTVDANGQPLMRPATPSDYIPLPFPNERAARASNNGSLPPDLSLIVKARVGGPNYLYSILTGYGQQPPAGVTVGSGRFYNPYFRGTQISMPPPLNPDSVTYADGTMATVEQEARDVVTFLSWAADPKMEERKRTGFSVMIFLIVLTSLLYFSYQRVWYGQH
ncbi:MAG TPA: cytochrome c1 [Blastocatellia bacterium]|nr:cytochrome c1 [Blastocatellia bacterium]